MTKLVAENRNLWVTNMFVYVVANVSVRERTLLSLVHDCGKIVGIVRPEPSNVHDPRAQAVYRNDGKLLGYIPRTQLDWYEDFNEQNVPCPFVGEIEVDGRGWLIAEIKVIIPTSREYVKIEIEDELL